MTASVDTRCPTCGADLLIAEDGSSGRCKFCRKDVILGAVAGGTPRGNLLALARAAAEAGNDEEASALWSRVLESDPGSAEAWLGKARAVSMTLASMQARFVEAASYCGRAIDVAADKDDVRAETSAILTSHLDVMARAAQEHFDEFSSVDSASAEYLENMFVITEAYNSVADLAESKTPHLYAVQLCDGLIERMRLLGMKKGGLLDELTRRRAEHLQKGGALVAAALAGDDGGAGLSAGSPSGADGAARSAGPMPRLKPAQIALLVLLAVLLVLSVVGFGRWNPDAQANQSAQPPASASEATPSAPPSAGAPASAPVSASAPKASGSSRPRSTTTAASASSRAVAAPTATAKSACYRYPSDCPASAESLMGSGWAGSHCACAFLPGLGACCPKGCIKENAGDGSDYKFLPVDCK